MKEVPEGRRNRNLVVIDGERGAGKSTLARHLRGYFGCGVLELGPLFRVTAWFLLRHRRSANHLVVNALRSAMSRGEIVIIPEADGYLAATRIEVYGSLFESELWSNRIDRAVRDLATKREIVAGVYQLAREIVGERRHIIVGREAGHTCFPEAAFKLALRASRAMRSTRKMLQISELIAERDFQLDAPEAVSIWKVSPEAHVIDTGVTPMEEVAEQTILRIRRELHWVPSEFPALPATFHLR